MGAEQLHRRRDRRRHPWRGGLTVPPGPERARDPLRRPDPHLPRCRAPRTVPRARPARSRPAGPEGRGRPRPHDPGWPTVNTTEVLARLTAHWPALGGDDAYAEIRLADWAAAIDRFPPDVRAETIRTLIVGWEGDWHPMIADWLTLARQTMTRLEQERQQPALEAPPDEDLLGTRARVQALIR